MAQRTVPAWLAPLVMGILGGAVGALGVEGLLLRPSGALGSAVGSVGRPVSSAVTIQAGDTAAIKAAIERVDPSVVLVSTVEREVSLLGAPLERTGTGTGFVFDSQRGLILTNYHVLQPGADAPDAQPSVRMRQPDGSEVELRAFLIAADQLLDVALLKVDAANLPSVALGDASSLRVGDWVVAIGCPFGLEHSASVGIVSSLGRRFSVDGRQYTDMIQTDAAINPGNSGGPLVSLAGEVIGMNSVIQSPSQASAGVGFAISARKLRDTVESLLSDSYVGLHVGDQPETLLAQFGAPIGHTCTVTGVVPHGPGERAGVQEGDILLEMDGKPVSNAAELVRMVQRAEPGREVGLAVYRLSLTERRGRTLDLRIAIESRGAR